MRKLLAAATLALFTLSIQAAYAGDRIVIYAGTNPSATQTNLEFRLERLSNGTFIRDALGPSAIAGGVYSNLTVVPNGGMNVAVQPTSSIVGPGVLYQLGQLDVHALPQGSTSTNQLPADTTPIAVNAIQPSSIGGLGPIAAPVTGTSQYILVEGQVQNNDTTPKLFGTISASGGQGIETVPSLRQDQVVYQLKYGTAAAGPTKPTVDTGWIPLADILVPSGTTTITGGMIAMRTPFSGFAQNGLAGNFSTLTLGNTGSGCLQSNSSGGVVSLPCTSGLGQVVGTSPVTATTNAGVATVGLGHGDYGDITNAQTFTGAKTFSQSVAVGGSANVSPALTVSNNPSSTSTYSPRIYVAQNVSGGGKYGFDSLNNQLRLLYTPYTIPSGSEIALGYFDNTGQYHVGATTLGVNTNIAGNLTSGPASLGTTQVNGTLTATTGASIINDMRTWRTANAATGAIFFSQAGSNYLYFDGTKFNMTAGLTTPGAGAFGGAGSFGGGLTVTGAATTLSNGLTVNGPIAASSAINSSGAVTGASLTSNGALSVTGSSSFTGAVTANNGITSINDLATFRSSQPSSGALFFGNTNTRYLYYDGAAFNLAGGQLNSGAISASDTISTPLLNATGATIGGNGITTTGSASLNGASSNIQVGPSTPSSSNYIVHGTTGTYTYLAGVYNGNAHVESNLLQGVASNTHVQANFLTPFTNIPFCTFGLGASGASIPSTGVLVLTAYSGSAGAYTGIQIYNRTDTTANIGWQCQGY